MSVSLSIQCDQLLDVALGMKSQLIYIDLGYILREINPINQSIFCSFCGLKILLPIGYNTINKLPLFRCPQFVKFDSNIVLPTGQYKGYKSSCQ